MMTQLRNVGASQIEVNALTRYSLTPNVIGIYYNKPVDRDLASMLIENEERYMLSINC